MEETNNSDEERRLPMFAKVLCYLWTMLGIIFILSFPYQFFGGIAGMVSVIATGILMIIGAVLVLEKRYTGVVILGAVSAWFIYQNVKTLGFLMLMINRVDTGIYGKLMYLPFYFLPSVLGVISILYFFTSRRIREVFLGSKW